MSVSHPSITVLMPVYNGGRYLRGAMESILNQTFREYEFLVIDDGSTDKTPQVLAEYATADARIRVIPHLKNRGLIASLNHGLEEAKGHYIVRQDADDISSPDRLAKQIAALEQNRDLVLLGGHAEVMDAEGRATGAVIAPPSMDADIRWLLLSNSAFVHGLVAFRREAALACGGYDPDYRHAEDYEFWTRLMKQGSVANLSERLGSYRVHASSVSCTASVEQESNAERISRVLIEKSCATELSQEIAASIRSLLSGNGAVGLSEKAEELELFSRLWLRHAAPSLKYLSLFLDGFLAAIQANRRNGVGFETRVCDLADLVFNERQRRPPTQRKELSDMLVRMAGILLQNGLCESARYSRRLSLRMKPTNPVALRHCLSIHLKARKDHG